MTALMAAVAQMQPRRRQRRNEKVLLPRIFSVSNGTVCMASDTWSCCHNAYRVQRLKMVYTVRGLKPAVPLRVVE